MVTYLPIHFQKELIQDGGLNKLVFSNWYPATVPGVVHTDLIDNKIIEDPFYRLNERGVQWVDKEVTGFMKQPSM